MKSGTVLDIGCGDNGTSIKLGKLGFTVTCIDISKSLIKNLKNFININKIKLKAICADIERYHFKKKFDVIIISGVLHFISKSKIYQLIKEIKSHTTNKGLNIIIAFRSGDLS